MQRNVAASLLRRGTQLRASSQRVLRQSTKNTNTHLPFLRLATPPIRSISSTPGVYKGIQPETVDNPQSKQQETTPGGAAPVDLTPEQYHELSDLYMDVIVSNLEELQENRDDVDVEYSV